MAEGSILWAQEQFSCSICLDLLKDPVTIPCGHTYCTRCIACFWNRREQGQAYSCPQCRKTFNQRPDVSKNVLFAEMVAKLKKLTWKDDGSAHGDTEGVECDIKSVECDICAESKQRAIKFCLVCVNAYCQNHLEQHEISFKANGHNLIDATGRLQEMICPIHNEFLELFCRTDQQCICVLCMSDEHERHDTVPGVAEMIKIQGNLGVMKRKLMIMIQQREQEFQKLGEAVDSHKRSAQVAIEDSKRISAELISSIKRSCSELPQMIRDQEKEAVSRAEGLLEGLKSELDDLKGKNTELTQLLHTQDHIHLLQNYRSISVSGSSELPKSIEISSLLSFDVAKSLDKLRDKVQSFCREEMKVISGTVKKTEIVHGPINREEYLRYSRQFTLDLNSVNRYLRLSDGNRVIIDTDTSHKYPDHPDRFQGWKQLLCKESVSDDCYWEVDITGCHGASISVAYKNIGRKGLGNECKFGYNDQSWCLFCSPTRITFSHKKNETNLPVLSRFSRIGVYVDYSAGRLSFFNVSDTMSLMHSVQTTFTKPLHFGLGLSMGSTVKLCPLMN